MVWIMPLLSGPSPVGDTPVESVVLLPGCLGQMVTSVSSAVSSRSCCPCDGRLVVGSGTRPNLNNSPHHAQSADTFATVSFSRYELATTCPKSLK